MAPYLALPCNVSKNPEPTFSLKKTKLRHIKLTSRASPRLLKIIEVILGGNVVISTSNRPFDLLLLVTGELLKLLKLIIPNER